MIYYIQPTQLYYSYCIKEHRRIIEDIGNIEQPEKYPNQFLLSIFKIMMYLIIFISHAKITVYWVLIIIGILMDIVQNINTSFFTFVIKHLNTKQYFIY